MGVACNLAVIESAAAADAGCREFLVGLGGSATNDGGMGMISVGGFLEKVRGMKFTVACDVDTPYVDPDGASRVFAPQKGASAEDVEIQERRLLCYADRILSETGTDVRDMPGAGFSSIIAATPECMPLEEAIRPDNARFNIYNAVKDLLLATYYNFFVKYPILQIVIDFGSRGGIILVFLCCRSLWNLLPWRFGRAGLAPKRDFPAMPENPAPGTKFWFFRSLAIRGVEGVFSSDNLAAALLSVRF